MERELSACFTGHRPNGLPWRYKESDVRCKHLKRDLECLVERAFLDGYSKFYCGMALGVDMYAAEVVLKLRQEKKDISLHCVIPCKGQEQLWSAPLKRRYYEVLALADSVTVLNEAYHRACMNQRNRYMVDRSDLVIAVYDGKSTGGTRQTVEYAKKIGAKLEFIALEKEIY